MKRCLTAAATAAALLLTGCGNDKPTEPTSPLAQCAAAQAGNLKAAMCQVTRKESVAPVMEADYDRKCVQKDPKTSKCKKYKRVFDEMETKEPGYLQLCITDLTGAEACEHVNQATYDAYEPHDRYLGAVDQ